jgi:hypothetical protein
LALDALVKLQFYVRYLQGVLVAIRRLM